MRAVRTPQETTREAEDVDEDDDDEEEEIINLVSFSALLIPLLQTSTFLPLRLSSAPAPPFLLRLSSLPPPLLHPSDLLAPSSHPLFPLLPPVLLFPPSAFTFFDPNDPACLEILLDPQTTIPELFAVIRQWVPQVQHKIDLIGNEVGVRQGL